MDEKLFYRLMGSLDKAAEMAESYPILPEELKLSYLSILESIDTSNTACRISDIAHQIDMGLPYTSTLIREMQDLGLIKKVVLREDKRITHVQITASGQEALQKYYYQFHDELINNINIKNKKIKKMMKTLNKLHDDFTRATENVNIANDMVLDVAEESVDLVETYSKGIEEKK